MAAGLTIARSRLSDASRARSNTTVEELLPAEARLRTVETDGALEGAHCTLEVAHMLEGEIWGQGFPQPLFCDNFAVETQRVVGERHLKLRLVKDGRRYEAMRFGALEPLPDEGARRVPAGGERVQRPENHPAQRGALRMIRALALAALLLSLSRAR